MRKILVAALVLLLPAVMNADRLIRIPAETDSDFTSVQAMGYDVTSAAGPTDMWISWWKTASWRKPWSVIPRQAASHRMVPASAKG